MGPGDGSPIGDGRSTSCAVARTLFDGRAALLNVSSPFLDKVAKSDGLSPRTDLVSLSRITSRMLLFRCMFCGFGNALLGPLFESVLFSFKSNFTCRKPRGDDIGDSLLDCPGDSSPLDNGESGVSESTIRLGLSAYSSRLAIFACGT